LEPLLVFGKLYGEGLDTEGNPVTGKEHKQEGQCAKVFLSFVALFRIFYQNLNSYCKFIMLKALKCCKLHLCTLVFQQDIHKNALKN
jgi:hypothetical protein